MPDEATPVMCVCDHSWVREHRLKRAVKGEKPTEAYCLVAGCAMTKHEIKPDTVHHPVRLRASGVA